MKKIIILIMTIFISYNSIAQGPDIPPPGSTIRDNTIDKFVGTWLWANGIDTVKIILKKENVHMPGDYHVDCIVGFHLYKKGNSVIENSIEFANTFYTDKHSTILGTNNDGTNILSCTLKDISKNKLSKLKLTLNSSQTQLEWKLSNMEGVKIAPYSPGFTLPQSLTLTKQ